MKLSVRLATGFCALLAACAQAQPEQPPIASESGASGTLIVGNKGEDTVSFIDLKSGRELGRVPTAKWPHEIAVSPDGRQAAVVAYGDKTIDIFDVAGRKLVRRIDLGPNERPHGLLWLDDGRLVATAERTQSVALVDTRAGDKVTTIKTDQPGSHMVVVSPDKSRAYTANIAGGTVSVLDLAAGRKLRDLAVGGRPEGIALARNGRELWGGDLEGARVQAFDTATGAKLAEVRTGATPIRVMTSPDDRWIVTSNYGAGSLTLIDVETRKVVRELPVSGREDAGQVTILFSRDGKHLYVAETGPNRVAEVDLASGRVLRRLAAGEDGDGLAIAP